MPAVITDVLPDSPVYGTIISAGDALRSINGNIINDILDYQYYSYDSRLLLELTGKEGAVKLVRLQKPAGTDLGLEFESSLMDRQRSCSNKCIFCFIDQLPKGMRKTLYYKDDDIRLSFIEGNYVTLTNLCDEDIERIIRLRVSPINVSVHTLDPELRRLMFGGVSSEPCYRTVNYISSLVNAGITLNCQIVCCPGINDSGELEKTIEGLIKLGSNINSVSIVPVGLTKHRKGLYKLQPFNRNLAHNTILQVESYGRRCRKKRGSTVFYCADELYMTAGKRLPSDKYYENYPQLENGIGMMRLFITQFLSAMRNYYKSQRGTDYNQCNNQTQTCCTESNLYGTVITGTLAAPYITRLLQAPVKYGNMVSKSIPEMNRVFQRYKVRAIKNKFFGRNITVSGLVTGKDIIEQLQGTDSGKVLLVPKNMLRCGDDVFLDDVTVHDVSQALGVHVTVVGTDGKELFNALMKNMEEGHV